MEKIEPVQFDHLFEEQLAMYEPDLARVKAEQEEHDRVVTRLQEAHDTFLAARKGCASGSREREQALQRLENAYLKYKELASNLDVGRKWYNDLAKIVVKFRDECKEFFYVRRQKADQLRRYDFSLLTSIDLGPPPPFFSFPLE
jgi:programmed cell death 6-interacting protein